jgi:hypothetical protein
MELDHATAAKFDKVLDSVKEPQSELSIGELGLVKKFSYHAAKRRLRSISISNPRNGMSCLQRGERLYSLHHSARPHNCS